MAKRSAHGTEVARFHKEVTDSEPGYVHEYDYALFSDGKVLKRSRTAVTHGGRTTRSASHWKLVRFKDKTAKTPEQVTALLEGNGYRRVSPFLQGGRAA